MADSDHVLSEAKQNRHKAIKVAEDLKIGDKIGNCFVLAGHPDSPPQKLEKGHYWFNTLAIPGSGYMLRREYPYAPNNMAQRLKCVHVETGELVFFAEEKATSFKYEVFRPGSWTNTLIQFWGRMTYIHNNREAIDLTNRFSGFDPENRIY